MTIESDLASALAKLASQGREPGGGFAVVTADGKTHEALIGERVAGDPWRSDTMAMTYSCAKPLAALTVLTALADTETSPDEFVATVWPEYATGGKESTTIRQVLSHQAGLAAFPATASTIDFDNRAGLVGCLAAAEVSAKPGTTVAEHAYTYGHLCDELVRRLTAEPLAERFGQIAQQSNWDLRLAVSQVEDNRIADVVPLAGDWETAVDADPNWGPVVRYPFGLRDPAVLNSTRFRRTSFAAISLYASAAGLASFYADIAQPDGHVAGLLGPTLHAEFLRPQVTGHDLVLDHEVTWTLGFQVDRLESGRVEIGMGGAGGSAGWLTLDENGHFVSAAAYVSRGLGDFDRADEVWDSLTLP
ncbi:MAG TPA: serine hydrolase domain-containing protein [Aeromicrobium sp.]|nr:serine hydrolase domain-containing protein [Aeromicrobium sp.]